MFTPWKKISENTTIVGFRSIVSKIFELPDGARATYDIFSQGQSAAVLALTKDKQVIVVKQFRPGPERFLFDIPGGFVDPGETVPAAIERELLEETGYQGKIQSLGWSYDSAYSDRIRHHFLAVDCEKIAEPSLGQHEFIEMLLMTIPEFQEVLELGLCSDSLTALKGLNAILAQD